MCLQGIKTEKKCRVQQQQQKITLLTSSFYELAKLRAKRSEACTHCQRPRVKVHCTKCTTLHYCSKKCRGFTTKKEAKLCEEIGTLLDTIRSEHRRTLNLPVLGQQKLALVQSEYDPKRCSHCERDKRNLKTCAGCGMAKYCSRKCQLKDWGIKHKDHCTEVGRLRETIRDLDDEVYTHARILIGAPADLFINFVLPYFSTPNYSIKSLLPPKGDDDCWDEIYWY